MGLRPPLTITINVPLTFNESERRRVGKLAIDHIRDRSKRGLGVGGQRLRGPDGDGKYSQSYKNSAEFKAVGKTGSRVNLTFSGEMLFAMEIESTRPGQVIIGFGDDEENNDKAAFLKEKNYDFFGLSQSEEQEIIKRAGVNAEVAEISDTLISNFLRDLFRG